VIRLADMVWNDLTAITYQVTSGAQGLMLDCSIGILDGNPDRRDVVGSVAEIRTLAR
jgi:hypothetical protein